MLGSLLNEFLSSLSLGNGTETLTFFVSLDEHLLIDAPSKCRTLKELGFKFGFGGKLLVIKEPN